MSRACRAVIGRYFDAFNRGDPEAMLELMSSTVVHDINQGKRERGRAAFRAFLGRMNQSYREKVTKLEIMTGKSAGRVAAEFVVEGTYIATDKGLPKARGQRYRLPAGAFFDLRNGRISRVTMYYNLQDWLAQVRGR
jgi:steroid delta-isomerase-like uncharacterized protein